MKKSTLTTILCCMLLCLFWECKKDETQTPTSHIREQIGLSPSMFQFPGIHVETSDIYGTYLKIDSIQALDHLERFLYNKSDDLRTVWEHAIGFLSHETVDRIRIKDYIAQLTTLEQSLDSSQTSYDTIYSHYLHLQHRRSLTGEMNKLINENGYVMFKGTMWHIDGATSYKILGNTVVQEYPTFVFRENDPCYQSKLLWTQYEYHHDTSSTDRYDCFDRRLKLECIHYKNVWNYSYCKIRMTQDYKLCHGGRWMPMIASSMNVYVDLQYELDSNPLDPPSTRTKQENCYELEFQLFSGPGNFCIKSATIECSTSITSSLPSKLEFNINW